MFATFVISILFLTVSLASLQIYKEEKRKANNLLHPERMNWYMD